MIKFLLIFTLIGNVCYAEDTVFLEKNQPAPFSGYLFTEPKAKEIRIKLLEGEANKELNESLGKTNQWLLQNSELKDKQLTYAMERMNSLASTLRDERSTSNWERALYFSLGVVATGLAVYGVKKITE